VSNKKAFSSKDSREVGSEAAILQRVRNSSPAELGSPENGRGSSRPPIL
jgi:hypothetical protein